MSDIIVGGDDSLINPSYDTDDNACFQCVCY